MDLADIRRENFRRLLASLDSGDPRAEFARRFGCTRGYASQLINRERNIGERTARKLERTFGLPRYGLDVPPGQNAKILLDTDQIRDADERAATEQILLKITSGQWSASRLVALIDYLDEIYRRGS